MLARIAVLCLTLAALIAAPAAAQEALVDLPGGYVAYQPEGWRFDETSGASSSMGLRFEADGDGFMLMLPEHLARHAASGLISPVDPAALLTTIGELYALQTGGTAPISPAGLRFDRYGEAAAVEYQWEDASFRGDALRGAIILLVSPDFGVAAAAMLRPADALDVHESPIGQILASLRRRPANAIRLLDGYLIDLPADWGVTDAPDERAGTVLVVDSLLVTLVTAPAMPDYYPDASIVDLYGTFAGLHASVFGRPADADSLDVGVLGGRVAIYSRSAADGPSARFALLLGSDVASGVSTGLVFIAAEGPPAQIAARAGEIEAVALSVRPDGG